MTTLTSEGRRTVAKDAAISLFAQALGLSTVPASTEIAGGREFLKFKIGRNAPVYDQALRDTLKNLPSDNPYHGLLGFNIEPDVRFPLSLEADVLRGILARSTRVISSADRPGPLIQYVPFQNNEETLVIQPATHLIIGRRGVGKSTLISRARELLKRSGALCVVLDAQAYKKTTDESLILDVISDLARSIGRVARGSKNLAESAEQLEKFAQSVADGEIAAARLSATFKRLVESLTRSAKADLFIFLDDFHLIQVECQPSLIETIHGSLKGAGGWLKVAGLQSLLKAYDPRSKMGLQTPGDAQVISLDLTLMDPEAAEDHLRKILTSFLQMVGIDKPNQAIAEKAFQRLVWANAGVPRDFLQMFASSIEHAARAGRAKVELTDTNLAIGELGQQKMSDLEDDARNEEGQLKDVLNTIEKYCLGKKKINAFLIRSEASEDHKWVVTLSDLRLLHILHKTITPHKAGERYEAYMLDYSLFTGFRRRPNINQIMPADGKQFKAAELRKIPILPKGLIKG
jgi:hypothetical protein